MGNAQSAQENDERRRHVARTRRSMPDHHTRQHNENGDNRERSEVREAVASGNGGTQETSVEGNDARIQLLATSIRSDLKIDCPIDVIDQGRLRRFSHLSRVPHRMANAHPRAYMPSVISIGPYHWGSPSLKAMEVEKRQFLELNLWSKDETTWNAYVKLMAKLETGARRYYPDRVNAMDTNAFLSMMLLDGFYILGLLYPLSFVRVQSNDAHDAVDIWHDLLLLENQIPFVIVEHISEQWARDAGEDGEIVLVMIREQAAICIESVLCNLAIPFVIEPSQRPAQFEHLLYLLHSYFRPSKSHNSALEHGEHTPPSRPPNLISVNRYSAGRIAGRLLYKFSIVLLNWAYNFYNRNRPYQIEDSDGTSQRTSHCHLHLHRAGQYIESGIMFRVKEGRGHNRHSLLDITISNNVMEIPHLRVDESAYWLFGNLISFEQANASVEKDVTAYVIFMSQLMATGDDVGLLVREKIVQNQLGSNQDVSILFASLAREVMFDFDSEYHLSPICDTLQKQYRKPKRWRAVCVHWHGGNLWGWLGALVAFFLFVCSMIMTVFTIMAYVRLPDQSDKQV